MGSEVSSFETPLLCPACYCYFKDPVSLQCKHSVCKECLSGNRDEGPGASSEPACPICGNRSAIQFSNSFLHFGTAVHLQKHGVARCEPPDPLCPAHREEKKLFCLQDGEAICMVCQRAKQHRNHTVCPVQEKAADLKEELKEPLRLMKDKLKAFGRVKDMEVKMAGHIKTQAQQTEKQIKEEFKKLHQFLLDEEEARLAALREEEEQKSQRIKEKIENLIKEMTTLALAIRGVEDEMEIHDVSFIEHFNKIESRAQCEVEDPEVLSGALIDVAKHLGSLSFRVWEKMLHIVTYTPVTLDPNTAASSLVISDDLATVNITSDVQDVPSNPERFYPSACVLGSEGFSLGKHCWEVQVKDRSFWALGVVSQSTGRVGILRIQSAAGCWVIHLRKGKYAACTTPWTPLTLKKKPQRIRVQLDYDRGLVSFFNPTDMSHIYTFKHTFTEKLFPFFSPLVREKTPLSVCPPSIKIIKDPDEGNSV